MSTGTFLLSVKSKGFLDLTQPLDITSKSRFFSLTLLQQPQSYNVLRLQALDALTGETIKGVFFELTREMDQLPEEGLSDPQGSYEFTLVSAGTYTIRTRKAGYLTTTRAFQVRPEMLQDMEHNFLSVNLPLVKNLE